MTLLGSGIPLVIDTSAWARSHQPDVADRWTQTTIAGLLVACPVASLEILAWTRDEADFLAVSQALDALPQAPVTAGVCESALAAARDLGGSRRIPAADYLIAAAAAERGFGVLHEDGHFEVLATVLGFESVRLSRTG